MKEEFNRLIDQASPFQRSNIFGICIRLAFHDAGEADLRTTDKLGPDGCLSNNESNAGLIENDSLVITLIEPMWQKYCDKISRADFWALMGKLAAERADPTRTLRIPFQYGRKDNIDCSAGANRLPRSQDGISEFQRVFVQQMKLTLYDAVTLVGAHTVGHVHVKTSGFGVNLTPDELVTEFLHNAWDETPASFDNQYFVSMLEEPWINIQSTINPSKNIWEIPRNLSQDPLNTIDDRAYHPRTIMLNSDMVIGFPARTDYDVVTGSFIGLPGEQCGRDMLTNDQYGCKNQFGEFAGWPMNMYDQALKYTEDNHAFLRDFESAYMRMTTVGYKIAPGPIKDGKLGILKPLDLPAYWDPSPATLSPYGDAKSICPTANDVPYSVDGYPGTPFTINPFQNEFQNPRVLKPLHRTCRAEDTHCLLAYEIDVVDVQARPFNQAIPACSSRNATWFLSYGGIVPGPMIIIPAGHESIVRFNNKISNGYFNGSFSPCTGKRTGRPFSVHLHGSASLAPFDGWAEDETCRDETKDYVYPNNRPMTGWYHDHALHITSFNAYYGLAGFYLVSAKKKYGGCGEPWGLEDIEEHVMMLNDRVLTDQCQSRLDAHGAHEDNLFGDINLVNGIPYPRMSLEPKTYRFRLLNAAVSRTFNIKIKTLMGDDVSSSICKVIVSDGGYLPQPVPFPVSGLLMGVAERYEIVCDFTQQRGKTLYFWNENDFSQMKAIPYFCYSHLIAKITVSLSASVPRPPALNVSMTVDPWLVPLNQVLSETDIQKAINMANNGLYDRRMDFGRSNGHWVINGESWESFKIAADDVGHNTWELWQFRTGGSWFHPVHMHLVDFFILKREGGSGVRSYETRAPKDVLYLGPSNTVWVLARFGAHKGDYMFHCHNLMHEDNDMMRAMHMVNAEEGKTASTASQFVANPITKIIYGNYQYADPMLGETAGVPFAQRPSLTSEYAKTVLDKNLYRIFYPLAADVALMAGFSNPWKSKTCPLPPQ